MAWRWLQTAARGRRSPTAGFAPVTPWAPHKCSATCVGVAGGCGVVWCGVVWCGVDGGSTATVSFFFHCSHFLRGNCFDFVLWYSGLQRGSLRKPTPSLCRALEHKPMERPRLSLIGGWAGSGEAHDNCHHWQPEPVPPRLRKSQRPALGGGFGRKLRREGRTSDWGWGCC